MPSPDGGVFIPDLDGSGLVLKAQLGTGTPSSSTFLRGDGTWAAPGGGPGASWTTVEQDLGSTPVTRGSFTLVNAAITPSSKVIILHAPGPYTGKGTRADESEMDQLVALAEPGTGSAIVRWRVLGYITLGLVPSQGGNDVGQPNIQTLPASIAMNMFTPVMIGRVKGNVKFVYTLA